MCYPLYNILLNKILLLGTGSGFHTGSVYNLPEHNVPFFLCRMFFFYFVTKTQNWSKKYLTITVRYLKKWMSIVCTMWHMYFAGVLLAILEKLTIIKAIKSDDGTLETQSGTSTTKIFRYFILSLFDHKYPVYNLFFSSKRRCRSAYLKHIFVSSNMFLVCSLNQ